MPFRRQNRRLAFQLYQGWNARRAALLDRLRSYHGLAFGLAWGTSGPTSAFAWLRESLAAEKEGRAPRWATMEDWNTWAEDMKARARREVERTERRIAFVEALVNPHPNPNRGSLGA